MNIRRLVWDDWNRRHVGRHRVTPGEVEEACQSDHAVRRAYKGRIMLLGLTNGGRILAVVLAPKGRNVFYPVTAYAAGARLRRIYIREKRSART